MPPVGGIITEVVANPKNSRAESGFGVCEARQSRWIINTPNGVWLST